MNKQKTDWDLKLKLVREISEAMAYEYSEYDAMSNNDTPEEVAVNLLDKFITKTLQQQREEIVSEIEGIVGEDETLKGMNGPFGGLQDKMAVRNQFRNEIRERLKQI